MEGGVEAADQQQQDQQHLPHAEPQEALDEAQVSKEEDIE